MAFEFAVQHLSCAKRAGAVPAQASSKRTSNGVNRLRDTTSPNLANTSCICSLVAVRGTLAKNSCRREGNSEAAIRQRLCRLYKLYCHNHAVDTGVLRHSECHNSLQGQVHPFAGGGWRTHLCPNMPTLSPNMPTTR
jgi:hypothetical protein